MLNELTPLIMGTTIMGFLALLFVVFVVWSSITISKLKDYLHKRDKHYLERISGMEDLIKKEFLEVLRSIKKIN